MTQRPVARRRVTLRRIAIAAVVLVGLVLAVPLVLLALLEVDDYRGLLAAEVERRTGRAMRTEALALQVSLTPTFSARRVTVANAPWARQAHMLTVDRLEARVALLPLLVGRVEIRRLTLVRPRVELETAADGRRSWELGAGGPLGDDAPVERAEGPDLAFDVRAVELRELRITHLDAESGVLRVVAAPSLAIAGDGERLDVSLEGRFQDRPLALEGKVARLPVLLANAPYRLDLTLTVDELELSLDGELLRPLERIEFAGRAGLRIPDLGASTGLAERAVASGIPLEVTADGVSVTPSRLRAGALAFSLGDSRGTGAIDLGLGGERPSLAAELVLARLDLDQLLGPRRGPRAPERVFSDAPLDVGVLGALDARIGLVVAALRVAGAEIEEVRARAVLEGGTLELAPLDAGVGGSRARGRARVDATGEALEIAVALDAAGVDLTGLLAATGGADHLQGRADVSFDVTGRGESVAGIMGTLSGEARALVGDGRVRARAAEMMIGGVSALLSTMTTDDTEWSTVRCAAADFRIDAGLAEANVLLVDTEHATVTGEGTADLGAERLAMTFTPSPKALTLNVAVPVKVSGTFRDPRFRPDELATARRVGSVALLVFPPSAIAGLGALAVYGAGAAGAGLARDSGPEHPCLALASGAGPATAAPEQEPPTAQRAADEVKKQLDRATERIKDLFQ